MYPTKSCFAVTPLLVKDATEKRAPFRAQHLERLAKLFSEGALVIAGAYDDMSGGLLVFDLESEAAVKAVMDSDIYSKNGIWTGYSIKKLNRVLFEASDG